MELTGTTAAADRAPRFGGGLTQTALWVILVSSFMVMLDTTVVNVVLHNIAADLEIAGRVDWIVTSYMLGVAVVLPTSTQAVARFGERAVFATSLGVFTVGSLAAAAASTFPLLVASRVIQAAGGAALIPVGLAVIHREAPPERRGSILGLWGVVAMTAPAIGPVLGGWLASTSSWRWLFAINVPIGVIATVGALRSLSSSRERSDDPFDFRGLLAASTALAAALFGFSEAGNVGWVNPTVIVSISASVVATILLVRIEQRATRPALELELFAIPAFRLAIVATWVTTALLYARLVFVPLEFQSMHGYSALSVGLLLTPSAVTMAIGMSVGGRMSDRVGFRFPVGLGAGVLVLSHLAFGLRTMDTPVAVVVGLLCAQGLGSGLAVMPITVLAITVAPERLGTSASVQRAMHRQIGGSVGVALLATLVVSRIGSLTPGPDVAADAAQSAFNGVYLATALLALVLLLIVPGLPGPAALERDHAAPPA